MDTPSPRFSWVLETDRENTRQVAYQFRLIEVDGYMRPMGEPSETERIETEQSAWVSPPGMELKPRSAYLWKVRVWDNHGQDSGWSEPQRFGTGLLGDRWRADWVGDGGAVELFETAPARYFRRNLIIDTPPVRARLYVSAKGLVEPWINGKAVTNDLFVPGWPDYRRRLFYVSYDVTELLQEGDNTLGMVLGDGWYSGTMIPRHQFGREPRFAAFLDLMDADGNVATINSGEEWRWTDEGPIRMNSIYHGETYDARMELVDWCAPGAADGSWKPVTTRSGRHTPQAFTARLSPPVRRIETLQPKAVEEREPGVHIYDLGQNMVGWVRLKVKAKKGQQIRLRFTEMLNADGSLHTENLRKAKSTATYVAKGEGVEVWEPRFTYFGFRYVELSGVEEPLEDAIEGVVIHSDLPRRGHFECSDPMLNQLYSNTLWSQKGNFLELPTDCPQRDERTGWTGDAQVFAPTALYNMEAGAFYRQWLYSLRDGLRDSPNGGFPDVAPLTGFGFGSAGWSEAGFIVPWTVYLHTGDKRVLEESLPTIQHALEIMAAQSPDGLRISPATWGDWLSPGYPRYKSPPRQDLIGTAYYARAADIAARIADELGRPELAASNRALRDQAKGAYQKAYIEGNGVVADDVQTSYFLTLGFDLASDTQKGSVEDNLLRVIAEKDNHLATGFLGTPLIMPVLTEMGRTDLAYTILKQTSYPGWLYTVKNGATTIWERWDSWTPEDGFHPHNMNSFNHYAYGSVVGWFYSDIAGLQPLPEAPGWKRFRVAPKPGGGLSHASASLETPYGTAASNWRIEDERMKLSVTVPANSIAEIILPTDDWESVMLNGDLVESGIEGIELESGTHNFDFSIR
ncbi:family 78 glycoside hydrolase catalytic domain [Pelagicoccus sp. SDUM812002]|nr:family 78 glycoside hydrolase catalytic domain [Pelagicoccus sp. SDUM812002]